MNDSIKSIVATGRVIALTCLVFIQLQCTEPNTTDCFKLPQQPEKCQVEKQNIEPEDKMVLYCGMSCSESKNSIEQMGYSLFSGDYCCYTSSLPDGDSKSRWVESLDHLNDNIHLIVEWTSDSNGCRLGRFVFYNPEEHGGKKLFEKWEKHTHCDRLEEVLGMHVSHDEQ